MQGLILRVKQELLLGEIFGYKELILDHALYIYQG